MAAWEKDLADANGAWTVLDPTEWLNFATKYEKQSDHSLLAGGGCENPERSHTFGWIRCSRNITGFQLEALLHPNLPYGGPGLVAKGSFSPEGIHLRNLLRRIIRW